MLLESIETHNFRNLSGRLVCGSGINILYGNNGQGKTNWLEAIYLLATTKSFRTPRPQEAIKFGESLAVVRGRVARTAEIHRDMQVNIQSNTKSILINGKREPLTRYLGQLHAIAFTADELEVVRGTPDARRRFLDRGVLSLRHAYVQTLADYNKVIKQKNKLLQNAAETEMELSKVKQILAPWNEQLIALATQIHHARLDYVDRLNQALERGLFEREQVTIKYLSSLEGKGDLANYEALLNERLELRLQAEISSGYALIGPHRDDLEILFDERDIRTFGSSGQQRSALILLDLAAVTVYYAWHKEYPVFIMDDMDAELDQERIKSLIEYLDGRTQTFITTSKESLVEQYASRANIHEIKQGEVSFTAQQGGSKLSTASGTEKI
jgi:DNA replication and repair protein RecF